MSRACNRASTNDIALTHLRLLGEYNDDNMMIYQEKQAGAKGSSGRGEEKGMATSGVHATSDDEYTDVMSSPRAPSASNSARLSPGEGSMNSPGSSSLVMNGMDVSGARKPTSTGPSSTSSFAAGSGDSIATMSATYKTSGAYFSLSSENSQPQRSPRPTAPRTSGFSPGTKAPQSAAPIARPVAVPGKSMAGGNSGTGGRSPLSGGSNGNNGMKGTSGSSAPVPKRMQVPPPTQNTPSTSKSQTNRPSIQKCQGHTITGKISCMFFNHVWLSLGLLLLFSFYCWYRRRRGQSHDLDRGEYRQVAARYTDSAFADDDYSAGGDDYLSDDEDNAGWSTSHHNGRHVIEMKSIEGMEGPNGGLSLYEMNG